jgi:hypothetical protein
MTDEPRDRTKALIIERDRLRGELHRMTILAEELKMRAESTDYYKWLLDEALDVLQCVEAVLPPGAEKTRVVAFIAKLTDDEPDSEEAAEEPGAAV